MIKHRISRIIKVILIAMFAGVLFSFIVMALWNVLMPEIFGFRTISFWQALGLLVLSKLLFGGFRPYGGSPRWRRRMMDRWEQMTPEERAKFKQGMRRGCGFRRDSELSGAPSEAKV